MPAQSEKRHIRLDRDTQDRRVKIPLEEHAKIVRRYHTGKESYNQIARAYGVSKRLIIFIVKPHTLEASKAHHKERRKDGRYYSKEAHRIARKDTARYRRSLIPHFCPRCTTPVESLSSKLCPACKDVARLKRNAYYRAWRKQRKTRREA